MSSVYMKDVPDSLMRKLRANAMWSGRGVGKYCMVFLDEHVPAVRMTLDDGTVPTVGSTVLGSPGVADGGLGKGESAKGAVRRVERPVAAVEEKGNEAITFDLEKTEKVEAVPSPAPVRSGRTVCPSCEGPVHAWGGQQVRCDKCKKNFPEFGG